MGVSGRVLILHIRGNKETDPMGTVPSQEVRRMLVDAYVSRHQRIHLHCCGLHPQEIAKWISAFPECRFGVTGTVLGFSETQKDGVLRIPDDRLLLETDSPYLALHGLKRPNSPMYIGDIAREVARIRRDTTEYILRRTRENAFRLYFPGARC
nr:3'-5' ssDNA/RNA exonuclease TatD-like [Lytechinus pictus]